MRARVEWVLLCRDFPPLDARSSWVWPQWSCALPRLVTRYTVVLMSYWNLHVRRRLGHKTCRSWLIWWESPSRCTMSKNRSWCSPSWEVSWPGRLRLQGDARMYSEGSTSPMSCLTQRRERCTSGFVSGYWYFVSTTTSSRYV